MASFDHVRNGPPDAVRIARLTSARFPAPSAWNTALCSESTGRTVAPVLAARRMNSPPAQTRHSLFASATVAPRSIAAMVGLQSDRTADRRHHPISRTLGSLDQRRLRRLRPRCREPESALLEFAISTRISDHCVTRTDFTGNFPKRSGIAARADQTLRDSARGSRLIKSTVLAPIEPVAPRIVIDRTSMAGLNF